MPPGLDRRGPNAGHIRLEPALRDDIVTGLERMPGSPHAWPRSGPGNGTTRDEPMADIFISYKAERRPAVEYLAQVLRNYGYTVWFDYELLSGARFAPQIDREIRAAGAVIVLWCSLSVESHWVQEEADLARELGNILPARLDFASLPMGHRTVDFVNLASWDGNPRTGEALDRLLDQAALKVGREPAPNRKGLIDLEYQWRLHQRTLIAFPLDPGGARIDRERASQGASQGIASPRGAPMSTEPPRAPSGEADQRYRSAEESGDFAARFSVRDVKARAIRGTSIPPVAMRRPHSFTHHGITVSDPWAWLRDPGLLDVTDKDVLAYIDAENAYFAGIMKPLKPLSDELFAEMKGRIKEDDESVPQRDGDWLYWNEFEKGTGHRRWWRKRVDGGTDELLLDEAVLAAGKDYFRLGSINVSPDGRWLAYSVDDDGYEREKIRIKDLRNGTLLPETITDMGFGLVWTSDSAGFLYAHIDESWRSDGVRWHKLGQPAASDVEIFHEANAEFRVSVGKTRSRKWLIISTDDDRTSEVHLLPADDPSKPLSCVSPRQAGRKYKVDEHDGTLFIHTNDVDPNFRLAIARVDSPGEWQELIGASTQFYMTRVTCFADFFVVEGREDGLDQIEVYRYQGGAPRRITFPEESYVAKLDGNPEYAVDTVRLGYESMVRPRTVYDYDVASGKLTTLKVQEIPSGYDVSRYCTERLRIAARDGTSVPVSIVYPRGFPRTGSGKLCLYGFGAYGMASPPDFSTYRMSFLDRGMAFAIAHIRGGDELGVQWYHEGKLEKRTNTFNDFVDVAKGLIDLGYTSAGNIAALGRGAGAEVIGVALNSDPDLWGVAVADKPFVDVLNTMLDESLPLTPGEWPEWGNPITDPGAFELIRSYSPYDNVTSQNYPPIYISNNLHNPRVTYWEAVKWAAKLRATKTDRNLLLLRIDVDDRKAGRWSGLKEGADETAFVLWQLGLAG